jgi:hypothetical protein
MWNKIIYSINSTSYAISHHWNATENPQPIISQLIPIPSITHSLSLSLPLSLSPVSLLFLPIEPHAQRARNPSLFSPSNPLSPSFFSLSFFRSAEMGRNSPLRPLARLAWPPPEATPHHALPQTRTDNELLSLVRPSLCLPLLYAITWSEPSSSNRRCRAWLHHTPISTDPTSTTP